MNENNETISMSEEEIRDIILGMEYLEEHPEEFPDIEIIHF